MVYAEWLESRDSYRMLYSCRGFARDHGRATRRFAVACCRRIWHLLPDPRSRAAVEASALYAEDKISALGLQSAAHNAQLAHAEAFNSKRKIGASGEWAAQFAASQDAWFAATRASNFAYIAAGDPVTEPGPEKAAQARLLRCDFGSLPYRKVTIEPRWLSSDGERATILANAIDNQQAFERLPEMATVLERGGCKNDDVLSHCREPGPHVRGCWVIDLLLGIDVSTQPRTS